METLEEKLKAILATYSCPTCGTPLLSSGFSAPVAEAAPLEQKVLTQEAPRKRNVTREKQPASPARADSPQERKEAETLRRVDNFVADAVLETRGR